MSLEDEISTLTDRLMMLDGNNIKYQLMRGALELKKIVVCIWKVYLKLSIRTKTFDHVFYM